MKVVALDTYGATQVYHHLIKGKYGHGHKTYCGYPPVSEDTKYPSEAEAQEAGLRRCRNCQWDEQEETNG